MTIIVGFDAGMLPNAFLGWSVRRTFEPEEIPVSLIYLCTGLEPETKLSNNRKIDFLPQQFSAGGMRGELWKLGTTDFPVRFEQLYVNAASGDLLLRFRVYEEDFLGHPRSAKQNLLRLVWFVCGRGPDGFVSWPDEYVRLMWERFPKLMASIHRDGTLGWELRTMSDNPPESGEEVQAFWKAMLQVVGPDHWPPKA